MKAEWDLGVIRYGNDSDGIGQVDVLQVSAHNDGRSFREIARAFAGVDTLVAFHTECDTDDDIENAIGLRNSSLAIATR